MIVVADQTACVVALSVDCSGVFASDDVGYFLVHKTLSERICDFGICFVFVARYLARKRLSYDAARVGACSCNIACVRAVIKILRIVIFTCYHTAGKGAGHVACVFAVFIVAESFIVSHHSACGCVYIYVGIIFAVIKINCFARAVFAEYAAAVRIACVDSGIGVHRTVSDCQVSSVVARMFADDSAYTVVARYR